ncbi:prolyl oligopeptidase family serine peptidase [Porphyrobacter algicida]|uniref:Prolyl oligopeptidase family serine peptidase n=1 Tax=Qipengyuania algicida TaxID=1836209 RepID=A0A845AK69_9SPHN|nr:prolyl oligopeptidase family serine peptidase [Qipengyuania algicida]
MTSSRSASIRTSSLARTKGLTSLLGAVCIGLAGVSLAGTVPFAVAHAQPADATDSFAQKLAVPFQGGLVGAADAPVFAWQMNQAGVRNIWVAGPDGKGRQRTDYTLDDGIELSGLTLNADGTRLAFVRGGDAEFPDGDLPNTGPALVAPRQTLYVLDTAGNAAPESIGQGHGAAFAPDGQRIAFTREGMIMLWSPSGQAYRIAKVTGEVEELIWSPDGKQILFQEARSGHSLIGLIDLDSQTLRYLGSTLGYASDPAFSPDGSKIAFIQYLEPPAELENSTASFWSLRVVDVASGAVKTVWSAPQGEGSQYYGTRGRNLFWLKSGQLIFPWERTGWLHIYAVPATGAGDARDLTPDANEVENFRPTPDGKAMVYSANPGNLDSRRLFRVDLDGKRTKALTPENQFAFYPVFGGDRLAATVTDATHPAHMMLVDSMTALGLVPQVPSYRQPEVVTFKSDDGVTVHGQLFHGVGKGKRPALIFVHGGPRRQMVPAFSAMYYYSNSYIMNQELAARGYTVLSVNYRSGTNYGRAFREAQGKARAGASEYRDVLAGGKWLAARSDVDAKRVGIWGGSWGGYLTALALARNSDIFAAGVDFHGVHQMVRPVAESFSPEERLRQYQLQWDSSPMGSIAKWRSPVLIIHGDDDRSVPFSQSLLLARELTARGVPFEELAFPNERHDFYRFHDWLVSYRASLAFIDRELGGKK